MVKPGQSFLPEIIGEFNLAKNAGFLQESMGKVSIIPSYRTVCRIADIDNTSEDLFLRGMNLSDEGDLRKIFWIPMILF